MKTVRRDKNARGIIVQPPCINISKILVVSASGAV
jgi:hypothetical protein